MQLGGNAKLLRIFTGEADRIQHNFLYERIIMAAREQGLAGGTVLKGNMSFGASSYIYRSRHLNCSKTSRWLLKVLTITK